MKITSYKFFPLLVVIFLLQQTKVVAQHADVILFNGKIFTSDTSKLFVEALAIKGNKILATGTNKAIKNLSAAKTKQIDLKGKTVVPGFNDAHDHLGWLIPTGKSFITEFSVPGISKAAAIDSLLRLVKIASPGEWVYGTIGLTVLKDTSIRRRLLDSIAPNNPLMLAIMWGHGMILNSKALKLINVSDYSLDPLGGWYERMPGSKFITGALYEYAQFPAWQSLAIAEPDNLLKALRSHATEEIRLGITTVQNMSSILQGNATRHIFEIADLPVRTRIIPMPSTTSHNRSLAEWSNDNYHITPLTYVSGIKYVIDGTSINETAFMTKTYPNRNNWYGRLNFPIDTIKQILREALNSNRQLMMHIVGDSSTKIILQLMKEMASNEKWKSKRVRIEHGVRILSKPAIKDAKDLGIIIVHTPQNGMRSPLRTWLSLGIPVAIGPDGVINPFLNIMIVTTQQSNPDENITREQAVIAYTRGAAYAEFAEVYKGSLTPGKLADIAVLSQDIFTIPSQQLPATHSVLTIIDGKIVYVNDVEKIK